MEHCFRPLPFQTCPFLQHPIFISHQKCLRGDSPLSCALLHTLSRPPTRSFATLPLQAGRIDTAGGRQRFSLSETRCFLIPKATPGEEDWGTEIAVMTCLVFQLLFPFCPPSFLFSDLPEAKLFPRPPFHLSSLLPFSSGRDDRSR